MAKNSGQAGITTELVDLSVIVSGGLQGIAAVSGITERGEVGTATLIGSTSEYTKHFGKLIPESDFAHLCRRALERGARLMVSRVAHYTDVTDSSTVVGDKAELVVAAPAVATFTMAGTAGQVDAIDTLTPAATLTTAAVPFNTDIDQTAQDLVDHINTTAFDGAVATILSTDGTTVTIQIAMPFSYAGGTLVTTATGGLTLTPVDPFTSPTTGIEVNAANIGAWGNGLAITVANAKDRSVDEYDITVDLDGSPELQQVIFNVPKTMTLDTIADFNAECLLLKIPTTEVGNQFTEVGKTYLTGGAEDKTAITTTDFIGDSVAGTGLHVFDQYDNFVRIAIPEKAIPAIDIALAAYAENRTDCRAILRTPTNISGLGAVDYREGTGAYTHTAVNTHYASMLFGALRVTDPLTGAETTISVIGDYLGAATTKDSNEGAWFTVAGSKRGQITNALGLVYNLTPAREAEADLVSVLGINPVVDKKSLGMVFFGNRTLQKSKTLLQKENVADLWIFINRGIAPLIETELFDPNDFVTWKNIIRKVKPFMELLVSKRAIWKYLIEGDQNIDKIEDAVINSTASIDNGQYTFNLWISPKVGLEYIGIKVVATNSGVNFEELSGTVV